MRKTIDALRRRAPATDALSLVKTVAINTFDNSPSQPSRIIGCSKEITDIPLGAALRAQTA